MQIDMYNGHKTMVVVLLFPLELCHKLQPKIVEACYQLSSTRWMLNT